MLKDGRPFERSMHCGKPKHVPVFVNSDKNKKKVSLMTISYL